MDLASKLKRFTSAGFCILALAGCSTGGGETDQRPISEGGATTLRSKSGKVDVTRAPMTVAKNYFDRETTQDRSWAEVHNQSANTHWRFSCIPKFQFEIVDKKVEPKTASVVLKIKSVHIDLSAPVIIYLPKYAKPDVVAHEEGHVKIAREIYDDNAAAAAVRAGESVIGKEFKGTDATLDEACQLALNGAAQSIGRNFRMDTLYKLDRLSAFYDQFAPQHPETEFVDACIKGAYKAEKMFEEHNLSVESAKNAKLSLDPVDRSSPQENVQSTDSNQLSESSTNELAKLKDMPPPAPLGQIRARHLYKEIRSRN